MEPFFLIQIGLMIILAKVLGQLSERFKQPAVIGEIGAGMFLGFIVLVRNEWIDGFNDGFNGIFEGIGFTSHYGGFHFADDHAFEAMGTIGILFLLFLSGFEVDLKHLRNTSKAALVIAAGGVVVPFTMGYGLAWAMGWHYVEGLIIATILVATSVGVTARTLMDIGMLNSDVGTAILTAAIIDDIMGIIILTIVFGVGSGNLGAVELISVLVVVFGVLIIMVLFGQKIVPPLLEWCDRNLKMPKALSAISIALILILAGIAETAEVAAITGAFIAGLFIGETTQARRIIEDMRTVGYAVFIPLFFVYVGTLATKDAETFTNGSLILVALAFIVVAMASKIIGALIGARYVGFSTGDALKIGVGMMPRMEVALVVATAAIAKGVVDPGPGDDILTITLLMGLATTIATPLLIRFLYARDMMKEDEVPY